MNQIKLDIIKTIYEIPDTEASSFEELLNAICTRHQALQGIKDMENENVLSLNELKEEIAHWQ